MVFVIRMKSMRDKEDWTVIECRDPNGSLIDLWYDETKGYIECGIEVLSEHGYYDFEVVANPKDLDLGFISNYR